MFYLEISNGILFCQFPWSYLVGNKGRASGKPSSREPALGHGLRLRSTLKRAPKNRYLVHEGIFPKNDKFSRRFYTDLWYLLENY